MCSAEDDSNGDAGASGARMREVGFNEALRLEVKCGGVRGRPSRLEKVCGRNTRGFELVLYGRFKWRRVIEIFVKLGVLML